MKRPVYLLTCDLLLITCQLKFCLNWSSCPHDFQRVGVGGGGGGGWHIGVAESMGLVPNGCKLRIGTLIENRFIRSTGNATK